MRILLSSTNGAGHLNPLLPYGRALIGHGHEVRVAARKDVRATLETAGLARHEVTDEPNEEELKLFWSRLDAATGDQAHQVGVREGFAGIWALGHRCQSCNRSSAIGSPILSFANSAEFASAVAAEGAGIRHVRVAVHGGGAEEGLLRLATEPFDNLRRDAGLSPDDGAALRGELVFTSFPLSLDGLETTSSR